MSKTKASKTALITARNNPNTVDGIVAAEARIAFANDNDGLECPPDRIPHPGPLVGWLADNRSEWADALAKANEGLNGIDFRGQPAFLVSPAAEAAMILFGDPGTGWTFAFSPWTVGVIVIGQDTAPHPDKPGVEWPVQLLAVRRAPGKGLLVLTIDTVHRAWLAMPEAKRPLHPLAPVIRAWQARPVEVELDTRDNAIMPKSLFDWAGNAPSVLTFPRHDNELPLRPGLVEPDGELFLPGMEPAGSAVVPAPALVLAEEAGFGGLKSGRGARIDKRMLALALLAVPRSERHAGGHYTIRPTLRMLAHEWIWPAPASTGTGTDTRSGWRPSRHAVLLTRAIDAVTLAGVILPGGREWRPVMFRCLPDFTNLDSRAQIEIALPEKSHHGPLISRPALIAAGATSDPAFDGCLTLATLWDQAKAANGGYRIYATRPKVLRDPQGYLTHADGAHILGHERNPVRKNGKLQWRPGNTPQKDWRHPKAVLDGKERHPMADKVPVLDRDDRRRLFYGHASDKLFSNARVKAANSADDRLRILEAEGRVVIEDRNSGGWRILEPAPARGDDGV